jgi:hypothetical protein
MAYRRLYAGYQSYLTGVPVLRERDFDGRRVVMTSAQLEALNKALSALDAPVHEHDSVYGAQEHGRKRLFKRLQFLS